VELRGEAHDPILIPGDVFETVIDESRGFGPAAGKLAQKRRSIRLFLEEALFGAPCRRELVEEGCVPLSVFPPEGFGKDPFPGQVGTGQMIDILESPRADSRREPDVQVVDVGGDAAADKRGLEEA
jgi:hypothetical protein